MAFNAVEHLRHHVAFEFLQAFSFALALWWWFHLPVPGYAVAVVALVAAAMSIHGEMRPAHKVVWMLLIGAFLLLEFKSINKDRHDFSEADSARRAEEHKAFSEIAEGIHETITNSDKHFDATMGKTSDVIKSITGGSSYAVVVPILGSYRPDRPVPLAVENHGSHILTGVTVTVYQSGVWIEATHESILQSLANRINIGTLHPGERLVLAAQIYPASLMKLDDPKDSTRLFVYIAAQNFSSVEYLDFLPKQSGGWRFRYLLERQFAIKTANSKSGMPRKPHAIEQVDWSDDANNLKFISAARPLP